MDNWTRIITAGVGPIIVISACGLLCLAFYNRLAAVVTRLRAFHREQLHGQECLARLRRGRDDDVGAVRQQEVLGMLSVQIGHVTRRARLIRRALACLLLTIGALAACSLAVGLSTYAAWLAYVAVPLFVAGLLLVIAAVGFALAELRFAIDPVELEGQFVRQLSDDFRRAEHDAATNPMARTE